MKLPPEFSNKRTNESELQPGSEALARLRRGDGFKPTIFGFSEPPQ
jgi:hypothetical protein